MDNAVVDRIKDFILLFTSIVWEAMPFIVLGAVIAGLLEELLPQRLIARILPRNRVLAIGLGGMLGLVFPMCECGIIPIMRRLLRKGLPLSCCTAYLLAGPIINPIVILSTWYAFSGEDQSTTLASGDVVYQMGSWWMTGFRVGVGYLVAIGTSLVVESLHRKHGNSLLMPLVAPGGKLELVEDEDATGPRKSFMQRLSNISETALHDFVDITVFLILGALLAATARLWITHDLIAQWSGTHPALIILAMMGLAALLSLCSEADAFVAASFRTMLPAGKLAFLVLGPMLDLKLYMMYTRVFRPRLIATIFLSVIVQVFVYAYLVQLFWDTYAPQLLPAAAGP